MPVSADTLRDLLDYTSWATDRLLDAAGSLTPDELTHDFGTADKNVEVSMAHIFAADRVWLTRVQGTPSKMFLAPEERDLAFLRHEWPALLEQWKKWLVPLSDEDVLGKIAYHDLKGNPYTSPLWQIVQHVVNHGTHHRGQVSGFLRALGKVPPPLDLIRFYREQG
jgi:uncharacterized damage-inducible protein DinB